MKFDLTLAVVLVFFVPGGLLIFGMPVELIQSVDKWQIVGKPSDVTGAGILLSVIFLAGTMTDSVRTVTVQPVVSFVVRHLAPSRRWPIPRNYFDLIKKDSLEIFQFYNEKSSEYLRLHQNITTALSVISISHAVYHFNSWPTAFAVLLTSVWFGICTRSRRDLNFALQGFIDAHRAREDAHNDAPLWLPTMLTMSRRSNRWERK